MLGPELSQMLHRLARLKGTRTPKQKRLLNELAHLYQAFPTGPASDPEEIHTEIETALAGVSGGKRNYSGITIAGITTPGGGSAGICPVCGFSPVP
ncbi:MAG: hypothetical protein QOH67_4204 [Hyphomicrobiales bacterium]|nr:hypothetical protein [Hyphomicrobiales bacterium]